MKLLKFKVRQNNFMVYKINRKILTKKSYNRISKNLDFKISDNIISFGVKWGV